VALCERGTGVRPPSRAPSSSFEGAVRRPYESGWHSVTKLTLFLPHSVVQRRGWPHHEGWQNSQDMIPKRVRGTAFVDSFAGVRALNAPVGGAGTGATSSWGPRARRRLARGDDQPSSEADLTRGGVQTSSEADLTHGGVQPSSEVGFH
jgi:hypothetical protein